MIPLHEFEEKARNNAKRYFSDHALENLDLLLINFDNCDERNMSCEELLALALEINELYVYCQKTHYLRTYVFSNMCIKYRNTTGVCLFLLRIMNKCIGRGYVLKKEIGIV